MKACSDVKLNKIVRRLVTPAYDSGDMHTLEYTCTGSGANYYIIWISYWDSYTQGSTAVIDRAFLSTEERDFHQYIIGKGVNIVGSLDENGDPHFSISSEHNMCFSRICGYY